MDPWYHNYTALHWSAENGHRNVVIKLLHAKVDFNKRDKRGRSALHQVCLEGFESITSLLIGRGILIDASGKESHTPLILACKEGQGDIVKLLLDAGADKDCEDKTGCTCFHYHTFIIFTGKFVTLLT